MHNKEWYRAASRATRTITRNIKLLQLLLFSCRCVHNHAHSQLQSDQQLSMTYMSKVVDIVMKLQKQAAATLPPQRWGRKSNHAAGQMVSAVADTTNTAESSRQ